MPAKNCEDLSRKVLLSEVPVNFYEGQSLKVSRRLNDPGEATNVRFLKSDVPKFNVISKCIEFSFVLDSLEIPIVKR